MCKSSASIKCDTLVTEVSLDVLTFNGGLLATHFRLIFDNTVLENILKKNKRMFASKPP